MKDEQRRQIACTQLLVVVDQLAVPQPTETL
jgi:hypothetical protein